jgi:uncharacterized protein (UPF0147 family)
MEGRKVKIKIIKDTVVNSIVTEMRDKLKEKISEKEKIDEMLDLTKSKVISILNSMNEDEIMPKEEFKSEEEFKGHILEVVGKVRSKLYEEMKKEIGE